MSKFKKILHTLAPIAPIAASFLPVSAPLAAAIGGGAGLLGGGGLKGALKGAALSAGGNFLANGGLSSIGNSLGDSFGTAAGTPLEGGVGPTLGSGVKGALTSGGRSLFGGGGNLLSGLGSGLSSSYATPLLSAAIGTSTNNDAQDALLKQQQANRALYTPFLNSSFNPGDLSKDPGYQFRLSQGQDQLDRQQAARGNYFSGAALKGAQDYAQGLASTEYDDAFKRFQTDQQRKLGIAGSLAGVNENTGNINAGAITNEGNLLTGAGASLLGGTGINNAGQQMVAPGGFLGMGGYSPDVLAELYRRNPALFAGR